MSARDELAARQSGVVGELLRGRTPEGFDELRSRHTGRILAMKRVDGMTHVRPEIALLPRWRDRAIAFVLATSAGSCAHWDAEMFVEWVRDRPAADDGDWVVLDDLRAGRRRIATVEIATRRHLVWSRRGRLHALPALPALPN